MEELFDDPNWKEAELLQEQIEFWRERSFDENLSEKDRKYAEQKYISTVIRRGELTEKVKEKWEKENGPLPPLDEEEIKIVREMLAEDGIELNVEEIKRLLWSE